MNEIFGRFVSINDAGQTVSSSVKRYPKYQDMLDDQAPGVYGIVEETNNVYHRSNGQWVLGFRNVSDDKDYTAFEVLANDHVISPVEGELISTDYNSSTHVLNKDGLYRLTLVNADYKVSNELATGTISYVLKSDGLYQITMINKAYKAPNFDLRNDALYKGNNRTPYTDTKINGNECSRATHELTEIGIYSKVLVTNDYTSSNYIVNENGLFSIELVSSDYDDYFHTLKADGLYFKVARNEEIGDFVHEEIPVGMTHKFLIRGSVPQEQQDVIVDWGDGSIEYLNQIVPTSEINPDYKSSSYPIVYGMAHTYTNPGRYIVKIFGTTYSHIQHDEEASDKETTNLISRIFDADLPIGSALKSVDGLCKYAMRLTRVNVSAASSGKLLEMRNVTDLFSYCKNLITATGFNRYADFRYVSSIFFRCWNLRSTDFIIPNWCIFCDAAFFECKELISPIEKLLPQRTVGGGFDMSYVSLTRIFNTCSKLTGTIPTEMLWDNPYVKFNFGANETTIGICFKNASEEIRSQVPDIWGGFISTRE